MRKFMGMKLNNPNCTDKPIAKVLCLINILWSQKDRKNSKKKKSSQPSSLSLREVKGTIYIENENSEKNVKSLDEIFEKQYNYSF